MTSQVNIDVHFTCPECGREGDVTLWDGKAAEWECGEESSLCHRVLLVQPNGTVEVVGHWEVVHFYDLPSFTSPAPDEPPAGA